MPNANGPVNEIQALEKRRYRAMIEGDVVVLGEICSNDLIYTHSKGGSRRQAKLSSEGGFALFQVS
jgi:hypothetical protein